MSNPVCEANYDTYPAKSRLVLRQVAAVYCPHLSLIAKWCIDYQIPYRRYDFGTGNSLQKINHFTWCLNFYPFSYFILFISLSFCSAKACHVSSDKQTSTSLSPTDIRRSQFHHLRCHDGWWCNTLRLRHNICSDSLQGQVWACSQIKPFCIVVVDCWLQFRHGFVIMHQKKYRSEQLNRAVEGL